MTQGRGKFVVLALAILERRSLKCFKVKALRVPERRTLCWNHICSTLSCKSKKLSRNELLTRVDLHQIAVTLSNASFRGPSMPGLFDSVVFRN